MASGDQRSDGQQWWSRTGTAVADDGTPLAYAEGGPRGTLPLVCANGLGVSTFFWDYVGRYFAKSHHVIVWDYRGHGGSGEPASPGDITMQDIAADMHRVMDAVGIDRAVLVGHSLGCQAILQFYEDYPDNVLGLVPILGSFGRSAETFLDPRVGPAAFRAVQALGRYVPRAGRAAARLGLRSRLAMPFARLSGLVHSNLCKEEDLAPYLEHLSRIDFQVFAAFAASAQEHDASGILESIGAPTLVVSGERDLFTPSHLSESMVTRIPNAEHLEIPRGSHAALVEQPELINLRLEKFIQERVLAYRDALDTPTCARAAN